MQASVRLLCRQVSEIVIYLFIYLFVPFWHVLAVPDPDLKIGRGWGGHPEPYIRGGAVSKIILFRPLGPQFSLKIGGARPPGPLPWIHHCISL